MDTKSLFQQISQTMRTDFAKAGKIKHKPSRGVARENVLRRFLNERMPAKFGLGAGEIVGHARDTSRQSDIIIFDKLNGVPLLFDEATQIYPIDCVYGVIEGKSDLTKAELLDALEKIKAFKQMHLGGPIVQHVGPMQMVTPRSPPFGMIFATGLSSNSLKSLLTNLVEWERENPPSVWPNYICVHGVGAIYHVAAVFEDCFSSDKITAASWPTSMSWGDDSLFKFYSALHDVCVSMRLGPVQLSSYFDPAMRIGKYVVNGRGMEGDRVINGTAVPIRIAESALDRIVTWCRAKGKISRKDFWLKQLGQLPLGTDGTRFLNQQLFLYDPHGLPGMHEMQGEPVTMKDGIPTINSHSLLNTIELEINGDLYVITMSDFSESDYDEVSPRTGGDAA